MGLRYARHVTNAALDSVLEARQERPFASVADLYRRTCVERDGPESMIRAGFLDALPGGARGGRTRLLAETAGLPAKGRKGQKAQEELPLPHPATWWAVREDLPEEYLPPTAGRAERMEWEALALNVRRHPLAGDAERAALRDLGVRPSAEILSMPHGARARAAGLLESLQRPPTRSGRPVYFLLIEDERGLPQCTIFGEVYGRDGHLLHRSGAFLLDGRVEVDPRRGHSFLVEGIRDLGEALSGQEEVPSPRTAASSGALVKAQRGPRRGRRAG